MKRFAIVGALLFTACALADDGDQRAKLEGTWQLQTEGAKEPSSYTLKALPDGMQISGTDEGKVVVTVNCKMAQECKAKDEGRNATVMMYFNGPKLVENETIGSRTVRKRYSMKDDNTMEVEVIPIEPEGKTEIVVFKRATTQAAK